MKIRHKMYTLMVLYISGVITIALLFAGSFRASEKIRESILLGMEVQLESREIKSIMKDVIFDLFSPQVYAQTRSLTYSPRSAVNLTQWNQAVEQYQTVFQQFMDTSVFLQSSDEIIRDQYLTAMVMNQKALGLLSTMIDTVAAVREEYRMEENIYNAMQKDASLTGFFNDFQETAYYFSNSFESFMNYFITSLREEAVRAQNRQLIFSLSAAAVYILIAFAYTVYLTRDVSIKTTNLEKGFRELTLGNFEATPQIAGNDEFSQLNAGLNKLVISLKTNTDNLLNLSRDVTGVISEHSNISELHQIIVQAVLQDTSADAVALYTNKQAGDLCLDATAGDWDFSSGEYRLGAYLSSKIFRGRQPIRFRRAASNPEDEAYLPEAFTALPLVVDNTNYGVLVSVKTSESASFSDLGLISLENFREYASLVIDHFFKYRELMERREAQFLALQSQMQPHFIYNILGGMQGLIRKDDLDSLRQTIDSLKVMLRYIQSSNRFVVLEEELDFLQNYLGLQKIRFGKRLSYRFDIDPATEHVRIPRLLLQPLVENAVLHGIEPLEEGGELIISTRGIRRLGEQGAIIEIRDNGAGFDMGQKDRSENIGLNNIRQRLNIFKPDGFLEIASEPGVGTTVEMRI